LRLGGFQKFFPAPAIGGIGQSGRIEEFLVVVNGQRREIFGQQILLAVPLAGFQHTGQVDARVQRILDAGDVGVERGEGALGHKHGHRIVADLEEIGRVAGCDLGENAGVIVAAAYRLQLHLNIRIGGFKLFDDLEMGREPLDAVAGAHAQDDLGAFGQARRRGCDDDGLHDPAWGRRTARHQNNQQPKQKQECESFCHRDHPFCTQTDK
jgi:hypothetical protein